MNLNPAQAEYIDNLKKDYPDTEEVSLRKSLVEAGWPDFEVEEAIIRFGFKTHQNIPASTAVVSQVEAPVTAAVSVKDRVDEGEELTAVKAKGQGKALILIIGGIFFVLGLVALGYYFYQDIFKGGSTNLTDETILTAIYDKLSSINQTNYEVAFSLDVVPREPGALSFVESFPLSESELLKYQRDADRLRDAEKIINELRLVGPRVTNYYANTPATSGASLTYPQQLSHINLTMQDPSGSPYKYERLDSGASFALTIKFETAEAYIIARPLNSFNSGEEDDQFTVVLGPNDYVYSRNFTEQATTPKLFGIFSLGELEGFLPADLQIKFALGGSIDNAETAPADARLTAEGSVSFGGANFSAAVEGIKKSDKYYGIVRNFPAFFSDLSQIRGKWIVFTEADLRNYGYNYFYDNFIPSDKNERQVATKKAQAEFLKILQLASDLKLLQIATPVERELVGEETLTRYTLRINQAALLPFVDALYNESKDSEFALSESDYQKMQATLKSSEFNQSFNYLSEHLKFSLWLDKQGYPVKFEQYVRHIPSPEARALKDQQIEFRLTLNLRDINKKLEIKEPEESITFDELMMIITGESIEEILIKRQEKNINDMQNALRKYQTWAGRFPGTLTELTLARELVPQAAGNKSSAYTNTEYTNQQNKRPFLATIPNDVYTKEPYEYMVVGEDFNLTYQINLPVFTTEINPKLYYTYNSLLQSNNQKQPVLVLKFSNGKNVANKEIISAVQKDDADTDKDGLADRLEEVFGTNVNKADTDGDGFTDREEITTRSNPLGPGRLGGTEERYLY